MKYINLAKSTSFCFGCIVTGLIFLLVYNGSIIGKSPDVSVPSDVDMSPDISVPLDVSASVDVKASSDVNTGDMNKSTLINALESYYGEWEIVEDLGNHGMHSREPEIYVYEIGKVISFYEDVFRYDDSYEVWGPNISIEITSYYSLLVLNKMVHLEEMGFQKDTNYAAIRTTSNKDGFSHETIYIINDNELLFEGDYCHYYRAVRKS